MIVRLLDSDADQNLLVEAWHFRDTAPRWFRECLEIFKESFDEYLLNARNEFHFGAFDEERLFAVVRMIPTKTGTWNIHLSARKGTSFEELVATGLEVRRRMYPNGASFYGWLPERNRTIGKLYEAIGFVDSGVRMYKGIVHGKTVCWRHFWLINADCMGTPQPIK